MKLTEHLHPVGKLRMSRNIYINLFLSYAFMMCTEIILLPQFLKLGEMKFAIYMTV